ncbi:MAG: LuxR C-terminal-related transcriptional regulator [Pirellulaceae bacterium]
MSPTPINRIRFFCVSDDRAVKRTLRLAAETVGATFQFSTLSEVYATLDSSNPTCVFLQIGKAALRPPEAVPLDLDLGKLDFSERPTLIGIVNNGDVEGTMYAIRNGACSVLELPLEFSTATRQIRAAATFEFIHSKFRKRYAATSERFALLDDRQRRIVRLLVAGKTNREVASNLELGLRTIELERANIMTKLGVDSFPEMIQLASFEQQRQNMERPKFFFDILSKIIE